MRSNWLLLIGDLGKVAQYGLVRRVSFEIFAFDERVDAFFQVADWIAVASRTEDFRDQ